MSALADLERLLERLFERTSARVFRTRLRPVQLQRRIERAMELGRVAGSQKTIVPDRFRVHLQPADLSALGENDELSEIAGRLADGALAFARAHGFQLLERPSVALVADPSIESGNFTIDATFGGRRARETGGDPAAVVAIAEPPVPVVPAADVVPPDPAAVPREVAPPAAPRAGGIRDRDPDEADPTRTLVFRRPVVAGPRAVLRVVDKRGGERTIEVDGTILAIGRARDNGLVVDDTRISRYHGRLQARRGALVYTDLGSTNGSLVNGLRVDEIALGLGDRIELGDTTLVVESLPG